MQVALANCVLSTRCWNVACVISTATVVMLILLNCVPGGYCTIWSCGPKSKSLGRVGLRGSSITNSVGGVAAIAMPIGDEPTITVLVIVLLDVVITETLLAFWFVT